MSLELLTVCAFLVTTCVYWYRLRPDLRDAPMETKFAFIVQVVLSFGGAVFVNSLSAIPEFLAVATGMLLVILAVTRGRPALMLPSAALHSTPVGPAQARLEDETAHRVQRRFLIVFISLSLFSGTILFLVLNIDGSR